MMAGRVLREREARHLLASGDWMKEQDLERDFRAAAGATSPPAALWSDMKIVLAERTETAGVDPNEDLPPGMMGLRLGPYTIYKLGPTLRQAALRAFLVAASLLAGSQGVSAASMIGFFKAFLDGYERLADPDEQLVFEALYAVQHRAVHSRLNLGPPVADPSVGGLVVQLAGTMDDLRVAHALERLHKRGIVAEEAGRWTIRW